MVKVQNMLYEILAWLVGQQRQFFCILLIGNDSKDRLGMEILSLQLLSLQKLHVALDLSRVFINILYCIVGPGKQVEFHKNEQR